MPQVRFSEIAPVAAGLSEHLTSSDVKKIKMEGARLQQFTQGMEVENATIWLNARAASKGYAALNGTDVRVTKNQRAQIYAKAYNTLRQNEDKSWTRVGFGDLSFDDEFPTSEEAGIIHVPSKFVIVPVGTIMETEE